MINLRRKSHTPVVPIRILISTTVVPIRGVIHTAVMQIRILIGTTVMRIASAFLALTWGFRLTRWAYSIPMVRRPSSSVHIFKLLLLWNRLTNQSQTLWGASLGRGNESLYKWSRSHDQDGRHAQKCSKPLKIFFSGTGGPISTKLGIWHRGLQPIIVYTNDDPGLTLT